MDEEVASGHEEEPGQKGKFVSTNIKGSTHYFF